jgi:hypothetical protein
VLSVLIEVFFRPPEVLLGALYLCLFGIDLCFFLRNNRRALSLSSLELVLVDLELGSVSPELGFVSLMSSLSSSLSSVAADERRIVFEVFFVRLEVLSDRFDVLLLLLDLPSGRVRLS